MVRRRRPPHWHLILTTMGLLAAVTAVLYVGRGSVVVPAPVAIDSGPVAHPDPGSFATAVFSDTDSVLAALGIRPTLVAKRVGEAGEMDEITVHVPRDLPLASVNLHLTRLVAWHGGHVARGEEVGSGAVDLVCGIDTSLTTRFRLRVDAGSIRTSGRIALVVDGDGAAAADLERLWALAQPLTLVVPTREPGLRLRSQPSPANHQILVRHPDVTDSVSGASAAAVRRQLWALAERAADHGHAVAAAPILPATVSAFEDLLPRLETRGYRFVTLDELGR